MNLIKELLVTNLGRALIVLPFIMIANNLFGAALAGLNKVFSFERLKAGLFKGLLVYTGIALFAIISFYTNDLNVDFNGTTYTLIDAMYVIVWASVIAYGKDGIEKLAKLFKFESGKIEEEKENE